MGRFRARTRLGAAVFLATAVLATGVGPASAAPVTAVRGSAFGYWADQISFFGGAQLDSGPAPRVGLARNASNSPQTATQPTSLIQYGPAFLFSSNAITVNTSGSLGDTGSVTSSVSINDINTSRQEVLGEDNYDCCVPNGQSGAGEVRQATTIRPLTDVSSTCTATAAGSRTGSATITNGWLYTDSGWTDSDSVYPEPAAGAGGLDEHNPTKIALPTNPAPNTAFAGHIHLSATATDFFVMVLNEQTLNADGSITVTAVHEYYGYKLVNGQIVQDLPNSQGGSVLHGHLYLGQSVCGVNPTSFRRPPPQPDFDANAETDRAVFRNGTWFAAGQPTGFLGQAGDIPVPGDYDGDGDSDRAVYRNGTWFIEGQATVFHGNATDIPVPADYDGDGDTDPAIFRPSVGGWYIVGQPTVFHGLSTDIPVPGDYDGDGDAEPAVWRPSVGGWYVLGQTTQFLGLNGDIPVPGDYDGSGDTERAIWRPSVGGWYVEGQAPVFLGLSGDRPQPGDYDGDGDTDRAIWRPGVGGWYVDGQTTVFLGLSGDTPLSLPHAIYRNFF
jgi:hypothetical protein